MPAIFPATFRQTLSPRQQSFIASLAREHLVAPGLADLVRRAAEGTLERQNASSLIDALTIAPRRERSAPASAGASEYLETPSRGTRAGRMLQAGGIEATATMRNGEHVTVQVRTRRPQGRGWTNAAPGEDGARTNVTILGRRVGWINVDADGRWTLTLRTRNPEFRTAIIAIFEYAATGETESVARVQEASRCGRCFRTLTDPVSIDRGIGPECFGRDTGSQHVAAERAADGTAVERPPRGPVPTANFGPDPALREQAGPHVDREMVETQRAYEAAEAEMHRLVAEREREQETAAFLSDPDLAIERVEPTTTLRGITSTPTRTGAPSRGDIQVAQNLIAEALDAYLGDDRDGEAEFALTVFKQLAARV